MTREKRWSGKEGERDRCRIVRGGGLGSGVCQRVMQLMLNMSVSDTIFK